MMISRQTLQFCDFGPAHRRQVKDYTGKTMSGFIMQALNTVASPPWSERTVSMSSPTTRFPSTRGSQIPSWGQPLCPSWFCCSSFGVCYWSRNFEPSTIWCMSYGMSQASRIPTPPLHPLTMANYSCGGRACRGSDWESTDATKIDWWLALWAPFEPWGCPKCTKSSPFFASDFPGWWLLEWFW